MTTTLNKLTDLTIFASDIEAIDTDDENQVASLVSDMFALQTRLVTERVLATGWDTDEQTYEGLLYTEDEAYNWAIEPDGDDWILEFSEFA